MCEGYRRFFEHVAPYMDFMRDELAAGRPPARQPQHCRPRLLVNHTRKFPYRRCSGQAVALRYPTSQEYDGTVYCCDHFVFPEYRLGNIRENTFIEMMGSERQLAFGAAVRLSSLSETTADRRGYGDTRRETAAVRRLKVLQAICFRAETDTTLQ